MTWVARKCKHAARLSLEKLCEHLGETFPLVKVEKPTTMRTLQLPANRHHVPGAKSKDWQRGTSISPAAAAIIASDGCTVDAASVFYISPRFPQVLRTPSTDAGPPHRPGLRLSESPAGIGENTRR